MISSTIWNAAVSTKVVPQKCKLMPIGVMGSKSLALLD